MSGIIAMAVRFKCATHSPGDQLSGAGRRFHRPGARLPCRFRMRADAELNSRTISSSWGCTRWILCGPMGRGCEGATVRRVRIGAKVPAGRRRTISHRRPVGTAAIRRHLNVEHTRSPNRQRPAHRKLTSHPMHVEDGKRHEDAQRDHLRIFNCASDMRREADPVGRHREQVPNSAIPQLTNAAMYHGSSAQVAQMRVPRKGHEHIGSNEESDRLNGNGHEQDL